MEKLKGNLTLLSIYKACQMSLFPLSIITIFHQFQINLTPSEILIIQAAKSSVCAAGEFPAGWLADRIGYRRTLILGALSLLICWAIYSGSTSFSHILLADCFLGIGWSFIYGTDAAMLYETLKGLNREGELSKWNGRINFWGQMTEGTCAVIAGWLYTVSPRSPFYIQTGISLFNIVLAFKLVEPKRIKPRAGLKLKQIAGMFKFTFVTSPVLRYATILFIILGIASYLQVWMIQIYAKDSGVSLKWLGVNWAAANFCVAIGSLFSHRLEAKMGTIKTLYLCILLLAVGYTGLCLLPGIIGFMFYYFLTFERGINYPVINHIQQKVIKSDNRAGMLSITNFTFRLVFAVICPLAAWLISSCGFKIFYAVMGVSFTCGGLIICIKLKQSLNNEKAVDSIEDQ